MYCIGDMERHAEELVYPGYDLSDDSDRRQQILLPYGTAAQAEPGVPVEEAQACDDRWRRRGRKKSDRRDPEQ